MMQTVKKSALVPFPCAEMYSLVTDVQAYPDFINWCDSAKILSTQSNAESETVVAQVGINYQGFKKTFTTTNTNIANRCIEIRLHKSSEKMLKHLEGVWRFHDLGEGTKIELEMQFDLAGAFFNQMLGAVFTEIVSSQLDAFVARAEQLSQAQLATHAQMNTTI